MAEHLLEIENLYVQYNTDEAVVHAVNGMSLTLDRGEALGVVGETGAGKSTMALSVLKLLPPKVGQIKDGAIVYDGIDIIKANNHKMREIRGARVAMIFQDPMSSLNPIMTIGEQIYEVLELHFPQMSRSQKEQKVDEILELVGIQKARKNEYPHQFSGGMKQRVIIAIALACSPQILLADEPTTALDVTIQAQVLDMMNGLKEKAGTSVLLITHDLGVVAKMCDRVAIMYAGEIVELGTAEQIFDKTAHPYTQGLLDSLPRLAGTSKRLRSIPGLMPDPTALPKGCSFAERCSYATEECRQQKCGLEEIGSGHLVRCIHRLEKGGGKHECDT